MAAGREWAAARSLPTREKQTTPIVAMMITAKPRLSYPNFWTKTPPKIGPNAEPVISMAGVAATARLVASIRANKPNANVCVNSMTKTNTLVATAKGAKAVDCVINMAKKA